jgi:hypothetical protein
MLLGNAPTVCVVTCTRWLCRGVCCEADLPINLGEVLDVVNRVHAHEIFVDGVSRQRVRDDQQGGVGGWGDGGMGMV